VLDIGCGLKPEGDVNIDLFLGSEHRRRGKGPTLEPKTIPNFVLGDGQHLPFRDEVFDTVKSNQVIEHVKDPWLFILESFRATKRKVLIKCPHRYGITPPWRNLFRFGRSHVHINNFDAKWFKQVIPKLLETKNFSFTVETIYTGLIHKLIPLITWPNLLQVEILKWADR